jgi:nucleotide-binding universal stress UspA family protein
VVLERSWPPGTQLRLTHVVSPTGSQAAPFDSVASAGEALSSLAHNCFAVYPHLQLTVSIEEGVVADSLLDMSAEWGAELIVVGTNDRTGLDRLFLGSVSQSVLERAHCPVLIGRKAENGTRPQELGNVLVAVDDSPVSASAVEWLMKQPWAARKTIGLLSLVDRLPDSFAAHGISRASQLLLEHQHDKLVAYGWLEQWSNLLRQHAGMQHVPFGVAEGDAGDMILTAARNWPAELVVVGSHGRSGLTKLVLGSVSQKVAAHARCSVEVVRGQQSAYYDELRARVADQSYLDELLASGPPPSLPAQGSVVGNGVHVFFPTMF